MNFAEQQRDPRRHLFGLTSVVIFHAILIYALANGLGHKVIEVLKKPLEINLVTEELKAPPKVIPPPPAYVPPPEVVVEQSPEPAVVTIAPTEVPPAVVVPQVVSVGAVCPNHQGVLGRVQPPPQAQGVPGKVVVEFVVGTTGAVSDVVVVSSSNRIFNAVATAAVSRLRCVGQSQGVRVRVPFVFEQER
jgi:protein TonB